MSTQLPIRLYRPLHRQQLAPTSLNRLFSTSRPAFRNAKSRGRVDSVAASSAARHQHNKAPTAYQEEQLSDERNVPDDIGLVPGTFVHAPLFPLTRFSLSDRMWYEWKWIRSRLGSWIQLWRFRRSFDTTKKPIMHWWSSRAQLKYRALQKYKHLHESFAKRFESGLAALHIERSNEISKAHRGAASRSPNGMEYDRRAHLQDRVESRESPFASWLRANWNTSGHPPHPKQTTTHGSERVEPGKQSRGIPCSAETIHPGRGQRLEGLGLHKL
ncbi:hypothetical protein BU23DRAFT_306281 [Bimuria novae-zelandiae CBS 107.79]|uniref:Uncharacterized protein n=1 Tax=Bimuria novae-zelandiae CBS 107.79 TaxID=1447943 RepID=A0A6A5UT32_9PLEO|nr:hypothetical protein BU23DRAFT_306281 [Bimuria novae-zelandiae CBS 107.79]